MSYFERRNYSVRHARIEDLNDLIELEKLCWKEPLRASRNILVKRLTIHPNGQFVLVLEEKVIGVIYSQRISNSKELYRSNSENVSALHKDDGEIVQLLAINVHPKCQERQFGDQLLEFMLQRCAMMSKIKKVVAVTLCRDYHKQKDIPLSKYIHQGIIQGTVSDPILFFHYLHGADIIDLIPNYRPKDIDNEGCGVLVQYDIRHRVRRDITFTTKNQDDNPHRYDKVGHQQIITEQPLDRTAQREIIRKYLEKIINVILGKNQENHLSEELTLIEMGLDSGDFLKLSEQLTVKFHQELSAAFFFQYNTIAKMISYFIEEVSDSEKQKISDKSENIACLQLTSTDIKKWQETKGHHVTYDQKENIAIIGMACRLPGKNNSPEVLWNFLKEGKSAISYLPKDRWLWPKEIDLKNKYIGIDQGGFLEDIQYFDADFFRIPSEEAKQIDPRQRILLELAWEVLNNSGYAENALSSSNTGVFIGASGSDYRLCLERNHKNINAYLTTGNSMAMLSNRLSYFYNFRGPSIVVDTACSSSLVALHQAIQSLQLKECNQALVGGVNIICNLYDTLSYYDAGLLSKDSKCKVFDNDANGYVRSEGAAILMLKPMEAAIRDNDLIYAVIKGSASMHGGKSSGLTVPNPEEQAKLLQDAWQDANIDPSTISYIEAHGTGTKLGDAIELFGIKNAFLEKSNYPRSCGIGSIKSNFGHLEAAGGIVGLLKVALSLKHHLLPRSINFKKISSQIELKDSPFYIVQENQVWAQQASGSEENMLLRAGISSFGSGGTNAHVILEEHRIQPQSSDGSYFYKNKPAKMSHPFNRKYFWYTESSTDGDESVNESIELCSESEKEHNIREKKIISVYSHLSLEEKVSLLLQVLISEQLGVSKIDSQCGFFEMGITSHQILKLSHEIQQKIAQNFSPNLFFIHKNIVSLSSYLSNHYPETCAKLAIAENGQLSLQSETNHELLSVEHGNIKISPQNSARYKPFPLNDIQESFLSGRKLDSATKVGAHIYLELDVTGFDIYRLNLAWKSLLDYHEMLRAIILPNGQQQILETPPLYQIKVNDLRKKSDSEQIDHLKILREECLIMCMRSMNGHYLIFESVSLLANRRCILVSMK